MQKYFKQEHIQVISLTFTSNFKTKFLNLKLGIVFGITNTFGTLPGIISPYVTGIITKNVKIDIFLT
jgi:hypothetical protein